MHIIYIYILNCHHSHTYYCTGAGPLPPLITHSMARDTRIWRPGLPSLQLQVSALVAKYNISFLSSHPLATGPLAGTDCPWPSTVRVLACPRPSSSVPALQPWQRPLPLRPGQPPPWHPCWRWPSCPALPALPFPAPVSGEASVLATKRSKILWLPRPPGYFLHAVTFRALFSNLRVYSIDSSKSIRSLPPSRELQPVISSDSTSYLSKRNPVPLVTPSFIVLPVHLPLPACPPAQVLEHPCGYCADSFNLECHFVLEQVSLVLNPYL